MQWLLIRNQDGGCDYTIGCGIDYEFFKAESREEAVKKAKDLLEDGGNLSTSEYAERLLSSARLIQVAHSELLPLEEWIGERRAEQEKQKRSEQEEKERAEYERLKNKFGESY